MRHIAIAFGLATTAMTAPLLAADLPAVLAARWRLAVVLSRVRVYALQGVRGV